MNDTWYKCTICGNEGTVGRCCGKETRVPPNAAATYEIVLDKLKPCPFCGSVPLVLHREEQGGSVHIIGCSNMDCIICLPESTGDSELHYYGWAYERLDEMIKDWNRRWKEDSDG